MRRCSPRPGRSSKTSALRLNEGAARTSSVVRKKGMPMIRMIAALTLGAALAKQLGAKVIIQHEPADISKLPAFPQAAE